MSVETRGSFSLEVNVKARGAQVAVKLGVSVVALVSGTVVTALVGLLTDYMA